MLINLSSIILEPEDIKGVDALIDFLSRHVTDVNAATSDDINQFVKNWQETKLKLPS